MPAVLAVLALAGCGDGTTEVREPSGEPRPVVVGADDLVYAERSVLHLGDRRVDLAPAVVSELDATPYGAFVSSG